MASIPGAEAFGFNPLYAIQELARQELTGDSLFLTKGVYFFELQITAESGIGVAANYLFPLVINPESYSLEEPFQVEMTRGQGGSLYVEENGIVERTIRLRGHTGFKPRKMNGTGAGALALLKPDAKSFGRNLSPVVVERLSGHAHFMYLQDAVFRTYADLKRDPNTAAGVKLMFHNPRDRESWWVVPRSFKLDRDASKPIHYNYDIDLLVVDAAPAAQLNVSEDQSILDTIRDTLRWVKSGADMVRGAIQDLSAVTGELRGLVGNVDTILGSASEILAATDNFTAGVTDLIQSPRALLTTTLDTSEQALSLAEDTVLRAQATGDTYNQMPFQVQATFRTLQDGLRRIGTHAGIFETTAQADLRAAQEKSSATQSASAEEIEEALASDSPSSFQAIEALGTSLTKGEAQAAQGDINTGGGVKVYTGTRAIRVARGDTLVSLAAAHLGDARLWRYIAAANNLKPPFINEQAAADTAAGDEAPLPGALGVGQVLLIPTYAKPQDAQPLLAVLGVTPEASADEHLLGADVELKRLERGVYDIPVDTVGGSSDAKMVRGVTNLEQAVTLRLVTEHGTDQLYQNVGLRRVVGFNVTPVDIELAKFRVAEAILADPRIAAIRDSRLIPQESPPDVINVDVTAEVRGYIAPVKVETLT